MTDMTAQAINLTNELMARLPLLTDPEAREYLVEIRSAIKALTAPRVPEGWIPVSERLPDEYGHYLAILSSGYSDDQIHLISYSPNTVRKWSNAFGIPAPIPAGVTVTHWMPLPEHPALTAAPATVDSDPMPMPLFQTAEGEELKRLRERVKVLELTAGYASHDIDNIALLLRGEEDLQKLCRGIAERLRLGEGR